MHIYLIRHAEALDEQQDPTRPLSPAGRATAERLARYVAALGPQLIDVPIREVLHSGKPRAAETAAIFALALCPDAPQSATDALKPNADPRTLFKLLNKRRPDDAALMLVGHLPHLDRLAGLLLADDADCAPINFAKPALLKLIPLADRWAAAAYLTPACVVVK